MLHMHNRGVVLFLPYILKCLVDIQASNPNIVLLKCELRALSVGACFFKNYSTAHTPFNLIKSYL